MLPVPLHFSQYTSPSWHVGLSACAWLWAPHPTLKFVPAKLVAFARRPLSPEAPVALPSPADNVLVHCATGELLALRCADALPASARSVWECGHSLCSGEVGSCCLRTPL